MSKGRCIRCGKYSDRCEIFIGFRRNGLICPDCAVVERHRACAIGGFVILVLSVLVIWACLGCKV
jgi:hypothetical protein